MQHISFSWGYGLGPAVALVALTGPVSADYICGVDTTITTQWDCFDGVIELDVVIDEIDDSTFGTSTVEFSDINDSVGEGTYFFYVDNVGEDGDDHGDDGTSVDALGVTYEGDDTEIELISGADVPALAVVGEGGDGHSGKDRTSVTSSGDGGDGGDGGTVGGAQSLTISGGLTYGEVSGGGLYVYATGGSGGDGGDGRSYGLTDASGGSGGNGGDGADASLTIGDDATLSFEITGDDTDGIFAVSSGGDGGDGGKARGGESGAGGNAGSGGQAGDVTVQVSDGATLILTTTGANSQGIEASSVAGNGGDGGDSEDAVVLSYGGDGGAGGASGNVTVYVENADINTEGTDSIGILARSYGGAGGDGGDADSALNLGSGGSSLAANPSGDVDVTFSGAITTYGDGESTSSSSSSDASTTSSAILAQSVGGFAGNAGDVESGLSSWGASTESAGDAGDVSVTLLDGTSLETYGSYSLGIEAQSVGGGGGKGGSANDILAVGGDGSAAGDGSTVTVTVGDNATDDVSIYTGGSYSAGILAISVGGGGGNGGGATGIDTIGGTGGDGGDGGEVIIVSAADITTEGDYSEGILAQSIGGGGGKGHSSSGSLQSIGGNGGDGGDSGEVTFTHIGGEIETDGYDSDGIELQSIGGGGGKSSSSYEVGFLVELVVGSQGGDGGDGADVSFVESATETYEIETAGDFSNGISAQSGGGGGGSSADTRSYTIGFLTSVTVGSSDDASAGGDGGAVSLDTLADITTAGDNAYGIMAQSYGGGGGSAGDIVEVSAGVTLTTIEYNVGGDGGTGGDGGQVSVSTNGSIATDGENSVGVFAQSVGGGGGTSSSLYSVSSVSLTSLDISVGSTGGDGGDGDTVDVSIYDDITTNGDNATAVYAQSVGGGGGNAGQVWAVSSLSVSSVSVALGGDGGSGGDGGDVTVVSEGALTTTGANADGIFAQSLGGSGGNAATTISGSALSIVDSVNVTIAGTGEDGDVAGMVEVTNSGDISTRDDGAFGIYAESRGGGGGKAGLSAAVSGASVADVEVNVGGAGGDGGSGGTVTVDNSGDILVAKHNAGGIYATSAGGDGGSASTTFTTSGVSSAAVAISVGGGGGDGGTGGTVSVTNTGGIETDGYNSVGIYAQSLGGSGGSSSSIYSFGIEIGSISDGDSADLTVGVGSDGGDGGTGGAVSVYNYGTISTGAYGAHAVFAQSVGGSGGSAGSIYEGNISYAISSVDVSFALGGGGGSGSTGGDVYVLNSGSIQTDATYSHGVFAQSIGGDGGTGSSAYVAVVPQTIDLDLTAGVTIGGGGGDGAIGGAVEVENSGDIAVLGTGSTGVYLQSIGGDGGASGDSITSVLDVTNGTDGSFALAAAISVGGSGGSGNDAGAVSLTNSGSITAYEESSDGIYAQSVGGGGGDGGAASATAVAYSAGSTTLDSFSIKFGLALGGDGGASGDGSTVDIENSGEITIEGDVAYGIFAQSVGGGGGTGGEAGSQEASWVEDEDSLNTAYVVATDLISAYSIYSLVTDPLSLVTNWTLDIGGDAGASGDGDTVTISNSGNITTTGDSATAIYAQSVGGGGGTGGDGNGKITTKLTIGGEGGAGGHGGDVSVTNSGSITTSGEGAMGVFAQSVGGGGGAGGDTEGAFATFDLGTTMQIGFSFTEDAGNGGDGGSVDVYSVGDITTTGAYGHAIWAQSVGGGGGAAASTSDVSYSFSGSNGSEGDGGDVTVTSTGDISVSGEYAVGIIAQSSSGAYLTDDDTTDATSYYTYDGDGEYESGNVEISVYGDVISSGTSGRGIIGVSTGYDSGGAVDISIADTATVSTASDGWHTVTILDGFNNTLTNYGTIEQLGLYEDNSDDVYAIYSDVTDDSYDSYGTVSGNNTTTIKNYGTITGSVYLYDGGDYAHNFENLSGGVFNSGTTVVFGGDDEAGSFFNIGTLSPGDTGNILTTTFSGGDVYIGAGSTTIIDLDMGTSSGDESSDVIYATSSVSSFAGTVEVNVAGETAVSDGDSGSVYILVTDSLSNFTADVSDTVLVDYDISSLDDADSVTIDGVEYDGVDVVELSYSVDLTGTSSGGSTNTMVLVNYSSDVLTDDDTSLVSASDTSSSEIAAAKLVSSSSSDSAGDGTLSDEEKAKLALNELFLQLLNAPDGEALDALAEPHVIEEGGIAFAHSRFAAYRMHDSLHSCLNLSSADRATFLQEQECSWFTIGGTFGSFENTASSVPFDERSRSMSFGVQRQIDNGLFLEVMGQVDDLSYSSAGVFNQEGYRFSAGAALKKEIGPVTLSASATLGHYTLDNERYYTALGEDYQANGDIKGNYVSAELRATYLYNGSGYYLRPGLGLNMVHTLQDEIEETGDGVLNWSVDGFSETEVALRPQIEIGKELNISGRPGIIYLNTGVSIAVTDNDVTVPASLNELSGDHVAEHKYDPPDIIGLLAIGMDFDVSDNMSLSFEAQSELAENDYTVSGFVNFQWKF
ncbi:autotransporter outer membrane beta-barrel domain-containing protein [Ruegeria sp. SCP11]|uniref:autotransporter outer membrane beta-barrel domain-containing protein n=1 Tax=Ruegeria sp. SCP11 TaxID=3141378 RepID=UPI003337DAF2